MATKTAPPNAPQSEVDLTKWFAFIERTLSGRVFPTLPRGMTPKPAPDANVDEPDDSRQMALPFPHRLPLEEQAHHDREHEEFHRRRQEAEDEVESRI